MEISYDPIQPPPHRHPREAKPVCPAQSCSSRKMEVDRVQRGTGTTCSMSSKLQLERSEKFWCVMHGRVAMKSKNVL